jgi:hypothetical protein
VGHKGEYEEAADDHLDDSPLSFGFLTAVSL